MLKRMQAVREHRLLWGMLAENGDKFKSDSAHELGFVSYEDKCPACEYVTKSGQVRRDCRLCPINWGPKSLFGITKCFDTGTAFDDWKNAVTIKERKKYAKQIAKLPRRSLKDCKG